MGPPDRLTVSLDPALRLHAQEIRYVFRTLLRTAGFGVSFEWSNAESSGRSNADIYYGFDAAMSRAAVRIHASEHPFNAAATVVPAGLDEAESLPLLRFTGDTPGCVTRDGETVTFTRDLIFGFFWLLTGAAEPSYARDRWDNLHLGGSFALGTDIFSRPAVSLYADWIRRHFTGRGRQPLLPSWGVPNGRAAFAFTHDVDYPEIIRWIETVRALRLPAGGARLARQVIRGDSHFWKFDDWIGLADRVGTTPTFYFMSHRGSLRKYALGTPDAFYDISTARFRRLFDQLRERGCGIGLHASFHAHRSEGQLRREKELLEAVADLEVIGNRHHYWHLDPLRPAATLGLHERVGLQYDSSLGFDFYPGFRRGICHPFHVFDPEERRELRLLQLPPAWMDDHFDRRLPHNGITDPVGCARGLVEQCIRTNGVVIVDYHVRGMNADFFPRYGPWLDHFLREHLQNDVEFISAGQIVSATQHREHVLEERSVDHTMRSEVFLETAPPPIVEVGPARPDETGEIARLHARFFRGAEHGHSIANLGDEFLEHVFYRLNLDNPHFFCDVARHEGHVIAFSVYTTDRTRVFRRTVARKLFPLIFHTVRLVLNRPRVILSLLSNSRYVRGESLPSGHRVSGWWLLLGVLPEYRSSDFTRRLREPVAVSLANRMEQTMRDHGCTAWYAAPHPWNKAINRFLQAQGGHPTGSDTAQGLDVLYYVKDLSRSSDDATVVPHG